MVRLGMVTFENYDYAVRLGIVRLGLAWFDVVG